MSNSITFELEHMFPLSKWKALKEIAHQEGGFAFTDEQYALMLGDISNQFMNVW